MDDHGHSLFPGDTGTLPPEARRVLALLLLGPQLEARQSEALWSVVLRYREALTSRLHDLWLDLVIDDLSRTAFLRPVEVPDDQDRPPTILRSKPLTVVQSILLIFLRSKLGVSTLEGDRAVVTAEECIGHLEAYRPAGATNLSRYTRQYETALKKFKSFGVLRPMPDDEGRYEIAPSLRLVFDIDEVKQLKSAYEYSLSRGVGEADLEDEEEEEES